MTHRAEAQAQKITENKPKAEFYDNAAVADGTQFVQDVTKEFGMDSTELPKLIRDQEILMGDPNQHGPFIKLHNNNVPRHR